MEWRDPNTGQIKTWVWGVAAVGFVIFLFLITKVIGSGQSTTSGTMPVGGQSSDITEYLSQLNESLTDINNNNSNTPPTNTPPPTGGTTQKWKQYTVKPNDTWRDIAGMFGMTLPQFFEKNPALRNAGTADTLRKGGRTVMVFDVAAKTKTPVNYTLTQRIDSWREVVAKHNISLERFYALNPTLDTKRERNPRLMRKAGRTVVVGTSYT